MNNIANPTPDNGAGNNNTPIANGGGLTDQSNDFDPIMADIDAVFGGLEEPSSFDGKGIGMQSGGGENIPDNQGFQQQRDETAGMTPQQLAAHFQSKYDKLQAEFNKVLPEYEKYKNVADFVNQVYEDPTVKQAFLAEVAPDLYKPTDPYESLQEQLRKEFGEDFTPDDDEAARPLSKTWRYYKRADELYKAASSQNTGVPKTLKQLREEREAQARTARANAEAEKAEIMKELNWTENDWQDLVSWVPQLKTKHLAKWRQHLKKTAKSGRAPNLVNQFGGHTVLNKPEVFRELEGYFG